jgi:hypothetical protein
MNCGQATDNGLVVDDYVAGQGGGIGQDDFIAKDTVVSDMGICHDQATGAHFRYPAAAHSAPVDGHVFTNGVFVPDLQNGSFVAILQILWRTANAGLGLDMIICSQGRWPLESSKWFNTSTRSYRHFLFNNGIGTNLHSGV